MNIWKLTTEMDDRLLIAVVIALTPADARALLEARLAPAFIPDKPINCMQLGFASTNIRIPEIVSIAIV